MILLMLLSSACTPTLVSDSCLKFDKIRLTIEEVDFLSEESSRQIDNFNQEMEQCVK
jgi:hypothetical protein